MSKVGPIIFGTVTMYCGAVLIKDYRVKREFRNLLENYLRMTEFKPTMGLTEYNEKRILMVKNIVELEKWHASWNPAYELFHDVSNLSIEKQ